MRLPLILVIHFLTCTFASIPNGVPPMPPKQKLRPFYYIADHQGLQYASVLENAYGEAMDMVEKACSDLQLLLGATPDEKKAPAELRKWVKTARAAYHMFGIEADRNRPVQKPQTKADVLLVIQRYTKLRQVNTGKAPPDQTPSIQNFRIFTSPGFDKEEAPSKAHWVFQNSDDLYDSGTGKPNRVFVIPSSKRFATTKYWLPPTSDSLSESMMNDKACSLYEQGIVAFNPQDIIKRQKSQYKRDPPILLSHLPKIQAFDSQDEQGRTLINYDLSTKLESRVPETSLSMTFLHELLHLHDINFKDYEVSLSPGMTIPAGYPAGVYAPAYGWQRVTAEAIHSPFHAKLLPDAYVYFAVSAWYEDFHFVRFEGTAARLVNILNTDWNKDHRGGPPTEVSLLANLTAPLGPKRLESWVRRNMTSAKRYLGGFVSNALLPIKPMG